MSKKAMAVSERFLRRTMEEKGGHQDSKLFTRNPW
jgi:hypothetical protein